MLYLSSFLFLNAPIMKANVPWLSKTGRKWKMHSAGLMIAHVSLALSLGADFPNLAMHGAPPERQEMLAAAVRQGALRGTYTAWEGSLSLFHLGGGACPRACSWNVSGNGGQLPDTSSNLGVISRSLGVPKLCPESPCSWSRDAKHQTGLKVSSV